MLYIKFGIMLEDKKEPASYLQSADKIFDVYYHEEWLETDIAKDIIRRIDKSEVLGNNLIKSPVLGLIPTDWISGGAKCLILASYYDGLLLKGDLMGDNCWPILLELSINKDIQTTLGYFPIFNDWPEGARVMDIETGETAEDIKSFSDIHGKSASKYEHYRFNDVKWRLPLDKNIFTFDWED